MGASIRNPEPQVGHQLRAARRRFTHALFRPRKVRFHLPRLDEHLHESKATS
jgi:hypothetical protein